MKLVIANWKMNPQSQEEARALCEATLKLAAEHTGARVVICPPFLFLKDCASMAVTVPNASIGAQDVFWEDKGPYTGEVSPELLKGVGVQYVLIGHSDRRYVLKETDEMINGKLKAALENDLIPVLFIGEPDKATPRDDVLVDQISSALQDLTAEQVSKILFVYEPVWAISGNSQGQADTPNNAIEAIHFMKSVIARLYTGIFPEPLMLYGGSINGSNAASFLEKAEIAGVCVGSASLKPQEFEKIINVAAAL